ncbi:MAG: hypothetical protein JWP47_121 [Polaromonas sp.]|nr:hypothetical protein [Polaromonas sp.]
MRTTITLADDVLLLARRYARTESISLGEAISRLARQGLQVVAQPAAPQEPPPEALSVPQSRYPAETQGDAILTAEEVRRLLDENGPY